MPDRYVTKGNPEGEFEPGSDSLVLKNKLGITDVEAMEGKELDVLLAFQMTLFDRFPMEKVINVQDLCEWHREWLGDIYSWAGNYRTVNLSKGDFLFAASHRIPELMNDYQRRYLASFTPCLDMQEDELVNAMAICHLEYILIHPFRDGNGRLGRLLCTVMALQANMPVLDFELIEKDKNRYIQAIHAGHAGDYEPMKAIFSGVLAYSLQQSFRSEDND